MDEYGSYKVLNPDIFKVIQPGQRANFGDDKYCDWGPSEGHYVRSIDEVNNKVVLARDESAYVSDNPSADDLVELDLNTVPYTIDDSGTLLL